MAEATAMGRNILVFADGTANEGGLLPDESRTNVYKLFRATRVGPETCIDPDRQLAFYISGVGTPTPGAATSWRAKLREGIDQTFGIGLGEKIVECYVAIISGWRPGDRIHLFGFSRGAYTVRCLAHVLELMGIPTKQIDESSISLDPKLDFAHFRLRSRRDQRGGSRFRLEFWTSRHHTGMSLKPRRPISGVERQPERR